MTNLTQILIGDLGRTKGMFLARFENSKLSGWNFTEKVRLPGKAGFPS